MELLEELIRTSPIIEEHITGLDSLSGNPDEEGDKTIKDYVSEAIDILLTLLAEQGIHFHIDTSDLLSDQYNAKFLISLYQDFVPVALLSRLQDDPVLFKNISSVIEELNDNEVLVHILAAIKEYDESDNSRDMYVYLHDKVTNDDLYSESIREGLSELSSKSYAEEFPVLDGETSNFVDKLLLERTWFSAVIAKLLDLKLGIDFSEAEKLGEKFRLEFSQGNNISVFASYSKLQGCNCDLLAKTLHTTRTSSTHYVEHYTDEQLQQLSLTRVVVMILAQLSDKYLFNIEPNFDKLKTFTNFDIDVMLRRITKLVLTTRS